MSDATRRSTPFDDTLNRSAAEDLVLGRNGSPFELLGPHAVLDQDQHGWVIRAFLPGARRAWVVPATQATGSHGAALAPDAVEMRRVHPDGLFSGYLPDAGARPDYLLEAEYADGSHRRGRDPYAFGPLLSDYDLYLFGEGTLYELYHRLGAHPSEVDGVSGVTFAVWAPNARRVSVVGEFNGWDERLLPMRARSNGIWELFVPDLPVGTLYKYAVLSWNSGYRVLKADPVAFAAELRPGNASRVADLTGFEWTDQSWLSQRADQTPRKQHISIYEVHAGSWRPDAGPGAGGAVTYRELAHQLVAYVREMGYTHIELMPVAEHPFDGSWGYQVTGYYAPTSRFGTPHDFMYFVNHCHANGIGVLIDWVPAHFPKDEFGLNYFDGSHLYEHADPRQGEHPDWGTLVFNFGRNEVRNFLLANALFWLDVYHLDGVRVDAVASMLYLDYSREAGEWLRNKYGGRENLEAIDFLRRFNELVHGRFPGVMTVAEESTAWPLVSRPTYVGGLGFTFKWNMGWMHDILEYLKHDPVHRRYHHNSLTFSLMYAFSENFVLPFSHDEVVHVKGSMLNKMPGDAWQQFANLRTLYAYMFGHPGKKLMFMGDEFAQWAEWDFAGFLQWTLLDPTADGALSPHAQVRQLVRDLNALARAHGSLHELDAEQAGFEWIDCNDADNSIISFVRYSEDRSDALVFVCNFTPVPRSGYRVGMPAAGHYVELLNTDASAYGGSDVRNPGVLWTEPIATHGRDQSLSLTLPPLGTLILERTSPAAYEHAPADAAGASAPGPQVSTPATIAMTRRPSVGTTRVARRATPERRTTHGSARLTR
jgi:1,4-alpha-glucan branching enzyme